MPAIAVTWFKKSYLKKAATLPCRLVVGDRLERVPGTSALPADPDILLSRSNRRSGPISDIRLLANAIKLSKV